MMVQPRIHAGPRSIIASGLRQLVLVIAPTVLAAQLPAPVRQPARVVNNPAPNPDAPAFRLSVRPVVVAGGSDDDPTYDIPSLGPVEVTRDGRLLVAARGGGRGGVAHVQVFLPGGRYQKTIGRNGAGPGEFRQVGAMWLMAGDSLAVHDGTLRRVTVFDPAGRFVRTIPEVPSALCCFDDWSYLSQKSSAPPVARDDPRVRDTVTWLVGVGGRLDSAREILKVMTGDPSVWITRAVIRDYGRVEIGTNVAARVPFGRYATTAITATEIVYGVPDTYEFRVYDRAGTLTRIVRSAAAPVPVTRAMRAAARDAWGAGAPPELRARFQEKFDQLPLHATLPAFGELLTERDGTVWLRGVDPPGATRQWWARFDPTGRLLGTLSIPPGFIVQRFTNGHAVLSRYDDRDGATRLFVHLIEPVSR